LPYAAPEQKSGMFDCPTIVAEVEDQLPGIQAAGSWLRQFYGIFHGCCVDFFKNRRDRLPAPQLLFIKNGQSVD
jgi:hypothetical protein